jgi:hypothetical protein
VRTKVAERFHEFQRLLNRGRGAVDFEVVQALLILGRFAGLRLHLCAQHQHRHQDQQICRNLHRYLSVRRRLFRP